MRHTLWFLVMGLGLVTGTAQAGQGAAQMGTGPGAGDIFPQSAPSIVLILVGDGSGHVQSVSSGAIIRSDGIVLTAYRPLKGAEEVQVRLRDGEVYDQVTLLGFDERRDVAALHLPANGLASLPVAAPEEVRAGDRVRVLKADSAAAWSLYDGILGPVRLADEIPGAGDGYRVIQFMAPLPHGANGGALLNSQDQLLGIITSSPNAGVQQFAVPVGSVAGLPAQGLHVALGTGKNLAPPAVASNQVPALEEQTTPVRALVKARTLRVTTKTMYFTPFMLEKELLNNTEFRALGINVLDDCRGGELLVNVDRPLFTYDFTFSVSEARSGIVLATGKITAIDGPHAAQGIAKMLVQELEKARAVHAAQANGQEAPNAPPRLSTSM